MWELLTSEKEICIYCRGVYGIRTFLRLRDLGIHVECFGDADQRKQGYVLDGISCISYQEILCKDKENTVILVCKENPEKLMEKFRAEGFAHVCSHKAVSGFFQETPDFVLDARTIHVINNVRESIAKGTGSYQHNTWQLDRSGGIEAGLIQVLRDIKDRGEAVYGANSYR